MCSEFATCENTIGSYKCTCNEGYEGSGMRCDPLSYECPVISVKVSRVLRMLILEYVSEGV